MLTQADFDYYSGKDIPSPTRPVRPLAPKLSGATSKDLLHYATELSVFEEKYEAYKEAKKEYHKACEFRVNQLKQFLKSDLSLNEWQIDVLWGYAWQELHDEGLPAVVAYVEELDALFHKLSLPADMES